MTADSNAGIGAISLYMQYYLNKMKSGRWYFSLLSYGHYTPVKQAVSVWGSSVLKLRHLDSEVKYILHLPLNHTDSIKPTWHRKTKRSAIYRTILFLGNMLRSDESRRVLQPTWPIAKDNLTKPWHALLPDLQWKVSYFLPLADDTWLTALLWVLWWMCM